MSQSRITGAVLLCWEDCTSILSKHLTTLLQRPIQLCRMVEDYDYWCVASINGRFSPPVHLFSYFVTRAPTRGFMVSGCSVPTGTQKSRHAGACVG